VEKRFVSAWTYTWFCCFLWFTFPSYRVEAHGLIFQVAER
jgi:hypothetical protein